MNTFITSRWIAEFNKQLQRRQHSILYGNIHDQFLWRGVYQNIDEFLTSYFQDMGFNIVTRYDVVDGFNFLTSEMSDRFNHIAKNGVLGNPGNGIEQTPPPPNTPPGIDPRTPTAASNPANTRVRRRIAPEEAFANVRAVVSQGQTSTAVIIDLGDMLTSDPNRYSGDERNPLALLKKCTLEASVIKEGDLTGCRNTLVILSSDLKSIPEWFHLNNPNIKLVQVSSPNKEERKQFAQRFVGGFYGGDRLLHSQTEVEKIAEEFADLTEGFKAMELDALRLTSRQEQIPLKEKEVWRLVDFYKFGQKEDLWTQLSRDRVQRAQQELSRKVIGQPRAVNAVTTMLTSARVGLTINNNNNRSGKPRGIFFFVGPTGVGKTELAKAMTKLVFGDERAFARYDMSEYKEEHAAEKLTGAPPGCVGYEEGGQLTNRVLEQPYSILLFDEIEKAHPKVLDKFLQILEDGRLTDGKGQTAYFKQTAIIFTSNIGASDLTDPQSGTMIRPGIMNRVQSGEILNYDQVEAHFKGEVDWYFTSRIGRAELLNRLGDNIVVFDLLRPDFVSQIGDKFLKILVQAAKEKYNLNLVFQPTVLQCLSEKMSHGNNLLFGGRRIKTLLETLVERPLNAWIFQNYHDTAKLAGVKLNIDLDDGGYLEVSSS